MAGAISAGEAKRRVHGADEIAFLDIRDAVPFASGHPLLAAPCPVGRFDADLRWLAPRRNCPVLLVDGGDGTAAEAADRMAAFGYCDVSWIEGGVQAWADAGYTLYEGVNVPSKTLGELLYAEWRVPRIGADTLADWQSESRAFHLFDGRPADDFSRTTIPGACNAPNGELVHRAAEFLSDEAPVVVCCAGRTRGIVGAASVALAGFRQPVYALKNGTRGWLLSGRSLTRGATAQALPPLGAEGVRASRARAQDLIRRRGLSCIETGDVSAMQADSGRTTFVIDVRSREEFEAGSGADWVHAPLVQLVQATDRFIGVRRARLVLVDDTGLRAAVAAVFLSAMNFEVHVLIGAEMSATPRPLDDRAVPPPLPQDDSLDAARRYLAWETGLVGRLDAEERAEFRIGPSPF
ncbi:rhodanese-like domain-containing protein [Aureimonas altamirensis]|uniref:rhodanese-like domain-containing protein n=1 Tax=Aureimonas altamirensis TaxID=370622 RepID=UPI002554FD8E|nr:rhodanese-like domain-containing protein [Aureimonas altamirensis]